MIISLDGSSGNRSVWSDPGKSTTTPGKTTKIPGKHTKTNKTPERNHKTTPGKQKKKTGLKKTPALKEHHDNDNDPDDKLAGKQAGKRPTGDGAKMRCPLSI